MRQHSSATSGATNRPHRPRQRYNRPHNLDGRRVRHTEHRSTAAVHPKLRNSETLEPCAHATHPIKIAQSTSLTTVRGRSRPRAVSVCHLPLSSSYSIVSVWPGISCSSAAARAAASASAWVEKGSENTPLTL